MKKVITLLLMASLLFSSNRVSADPVYDDRISMISFRLAELEGVLSSSNNSYYNSLNNLNFAYEYGLYVSLLVNNYYDYLNKGEIEYYIKSYSNYINSYNSKFSESLVLGSYSKFTLKKFNTAMANNSLVIIPEFIKDELKELKSQYDSVKSASEKSKFLSLKGTLLSRISSLYYSYSSTLDTVVSLVEDGDFKYGNANEVLELRDALSFIAIDYSDLLKKGEEVYNNPASVGEVIIDSTRSIQENLTSVNSTNNKYYLTGDGSLSLLYLSLFSASSVYTPLKSYTGGKEFIESLTEIVGKDNVEDSLKIYNGTKGLVKPLYKRELDSKGNPTGIAKILTIAELFNDIKKGKSGSLSTVNGIFIFDTETQNWLYDQDNSYSITKVKYLSLFEKIKNFFEPMKATASSIESKLFAYNEITDEELLSSPLVMYGTKYLRSVDNTTSILLNNIMENTANLGSIHDKMSRYVFINAYGDVVTDNNLVILPGYANPMYYVDGDYYNPYSVAFMNSYPVMAVDREDFSITSKSDIGKYLIMDSIEDSNYNLAKAFKINSKGTVDDQGLQVPKLYTDFYVNNQLISPMLEENRVYFGELDKWNKDNKLYDYTPMSVKYSALVDNYSIFPYSVTDDVTNAVAKIIGVNAYHYLTADAETGVRRNMGKLNDNYLIFYLVLSGLEGTNNPEGFTKDKKLDYDFIAKDSMNRFTVNIKEISSSLIESLGKIDSVLGVKNTYVDSIFGTIFQLIKDNLFMVSVISICIILISFIKNRRDLLTSAAIAGSTLVILFVLLVLAPMYLPLGYNLFLNNFSESIAYKTIIMKNEELSSKAEVDVVELDESGNFAFNTNSLTLYRAGIGEIDKFYEDLAITSNLVTGGNIEILNKNSGIFVEGDSIKINTDILFNTLKIKSYPEIINDTALYQFKATKTVSNNVDYYTPYYQLVDSFILKLNTIVKVYNVPRKLLTYSNGNSKENYAVYTYLSSSPFLTPGNYAVNIFSDESSEKDIVQEELDYYKDLEQILLAEFGSNDDFLGISKLLYEEYTDYKDTSWWATLKTNGYYTSDNLPVEEKLNDLISYVNYHVRKYIFDSVDIIGTVSDETMIKIISLRALLALNQRASQMSEFMYPFTVSYEDLSLIDIMKTVFISDYYKYTELDLDLAGYVLEEYNWFNLIVFDIVIVLLFAVSCLLRVTIPVLYLLLALVYLIKLFINGDVNQSFKGFFKAMFAFMLMSTLLSISLIVCNNLRGSFVSIYFLLASLSLILYVTGNVVASIATNLLDLGNSTINARMLNVAKHLVPRGMEIKMPHIKRPTINRDMLHRNNRFLRYGNDRDSDDYYGNRRRRDDYDDGDYDSPRRRNQQEYDEEEHLTKGKFSGYTESVLDD